MLWCSDQDARTTAADKGHGDIYTRGLSALVIMAMAVVQNGGPKRRHPHHFVQTRADITRVCRQLSVGKLGELGVPVAGPVYVRVAEQGCIVARYTVVLSMSMYRTSHDKVGCLEARLHPA